MFVLQKATVMIENVNNNLYQEIKNGELTVQEIKSQLKMGKKNNFKQIKEIDLIEHKQKIKRLMSENKQFRERLHNRSQDYLQSLKRQQQQQKKQQQEQKALQLQRKRQLIRNRMFQKSQIMKKVKQQLTWTRQKVNEVKSKRFLYQQNEQTFKSKFLLPKLDEEKLILNRRKDKMKAIDMNDIIEHERNYYKLKQSRRINYSLTAKMIKSQISYNPPQFVPKSFQILEAQESLKKQFQQLKTKQTSINKLKQKQFIKNINQLHKIQNQIHKANSKIAQEEEQKQKEIKIKKKLTNQQTKKIGNQYFKTLIDQLKKVKAERKKQKIERQVKRLKQEQAKRLQEQKYNNPELELELQIKTQSILTLQKVQKVQKIHLIRSKKIQNIFKDQTIDPYTKYQKLKNQVNKLEIMIKLKNINSQDIHQRNDAAVCYLDSIKAKLKLLHVNEGN